MIGIMHIYLNALKKGKNKDKVVNVGKIVFKNSFEANRYIELKNKLDLGAITDLKTNVFLRIFDVNDVGLECFARLPFIYIENGKRYAEVFLGCRDSRALRIAALVKCILFKRYTIFVKIYVGDKEYDSAKIFEEGVMFLV